MILHPSLPHSPAFDWRYLASPGTPPDGRRRPASHPVPLLLPATLAAYSQDPGLVTAAYSLFAAGIIVQWQGTVALVQSIGAAPTETSWVQFAVAIWAIGSALLLARWIRNWLSFRATLSSAVPFVTELSFKVRSVLLAVEPGVFGVLRPVIVIPQDIANHLDPAELDAILAHEIIHIQRRDNLTAAPAHAHRNAVLVPSAGLVDRRQTRGGTRTCL